MEGGREQWEEASKGQGDSESRPCQPQWSGVKRVKHFLSFMVLVK